MKKVLYITSFAEIPAKGGPQLRTKNSITALNKCAELYVYSIEKLINKSTQHFLESNTKSFVQSTYYRRTFYFKFLEHLYNKFGTFLSDLFDRLIANEIIRIIRKEKIDVLWFAFPNTRLNILKLIRKKSNIYLVADTDSVWSRFINRQNQGDVKTILKASEVVKDEFVITQLANCITAPSRTDLNYYYELSDFKNIQLFYNVLDLDDYSLRNGKRSNQFCICGSFWPGSPMEHAARWFVDEIWNKINTEDYTLVIAGRNSENVLSNISSKNVKVLGTVESINDIFLKSRYSITPIFAESGTRFKILESIALNTPVITTKIGIEGLEDLTSDAIIVGDSNEEWKKVIQDIIKGYSKDLKVKCRDLVEVEYGITKATNQIIKILNNIE